MKRKLALCMVAIMLLAFVSTGVSSIVLAAEEEYAWVLVDTYKFPIPKGYNNSKEGDHYRYYASVEGNTVDVRLTNTRPDPYDLHAVYTWTDLPKIIKSEGKVTIRLEQEVLKTDYTGLLSSIQPTFKADAPDLELNAGTAGARAAKGVYADGKPTDKLRLALKDRDESFQKSTWVDLTLEFYKGGTVGQKKALYTSIFASGGNIGTRYTYEWKKVDAKPVEKPAPKPATPSGNSAEAFESGSRIMWLPTKGLGYRLFRSTNKNELGISVTDFYITSTSYADVNVEANTTYYYTVKPVLAEARPFEDIEEKLGDTIATFTVTTGSEVYKPGSFKHFILLKLDSPMMTVDGIEQEVDPGQGTTPIIINGRTMVPIRAVVESMGGTADWDGNTKQITLKARGSTVEMWANKKDLRVNGTGKQMDIVTTIKDGRTFVPVRFAAENIDCKVDWINSTKEVVIVYVD